MSFFPLSQIFVHAFTLNLSSYHHCPFCTWKSTGGCSQFISASLWHSYSSGFFPALESVLLEATVILGNHGVLSKHWKAIFAFSPGVPPSPLTLDFGCYLPISVLSSSHHVAFSTLSYICFPRVPHLELMGSVMSCTGSITEVSGISCVRHMAVLASPYRGLPCSSSLPRPGLLHPDHVENWGFSKFIREKKKSLKIYSFRFCNDKHNHRVY